MHPIIIIISTSSERFYEHQAVSLGDCIVHILWHKGLDLGRLPQPRTTLADCFREGRGGCSRCLATMES